MVYCFRNSVPFVTPSESLYADDEALFLNRDEKEVQVMEHILKLFADASGLNTNLAKTQFYPVQC
jgi:hypothetical protein